MGGKAGARFSRLDGGDGDGDGDGDAAEEGAHMHGATPSLSSSGRMATAEHSDSHSNSSASMRTATAPPTAALVYYMDDLPDEGVGSVARARAVMRQTVGDGLALEVTNEMATWSEDRLAAHFRAQAGELV